jgi:hypothetical protein
MPLVRLLSAFVERGGMALFLVAGGVTAVVQGASEVRLASASVRTSCTVLEAKVLPGSRGKVLPQVRLAHEVDGKRYEALDEGDSSGREAVERTVAAFPVGAKVPCRYVEGRPDLVIALDDRPHGKFALGAGIVLILVAVGAYFGSRRKSRA